MKFNPNQNCRCCLAMFSYMFINNQPSKTKTAPAMASERALSHKITFLKHFTT